MLGEARGHCAHLEPLMMDLETFEAHRERVVREPESCALTSACLTEAELALFERLRADGAAQRLEQERLSADWIATALDRWAESRGAVPVT